MPSFRWTVTADFDGVLHKYDGDWQGAEVIPGKPVDGAIEWLQELTETYDVAINSTRCITKEGCDAIRAWLKEFELSQGALENIYIGPEKMPSLLYVDDRGWRFDGKHFPSPAEIAKALPWWKK
jgi:hypothetical protein